MWWRDFVYIIQKTPIHGHVVTVSEQTHSQTTEFEYVTAYFVIVSELVMGGY